MHLKLCCKHTPFYLPNMVSGKYINKKAPLLFSFIFFFFMSLINYHPTINNIQICLPTPTFFNLSGTFEEEEAEELATTTQPYYKSRYYHHDLQSSSQPFILGLPHHLLPQTVMEPSRDYKPMITPAPSDPIRTVKERKLYPNKRHTRLSLTKPKRNKVKRVKLLFYQMLHIIFRAPTQSKIIE